MKNFTQIKNSMIHNQNLSPYEHRILTILLSYREGGTHPPLSYLSRISKMSTSSVTRTLKALRDKNILSWISGNYQKKQANYYKINDERFWKIWENPEKSDEQDLSETDF